MVTRKAVCRTLARRSASCLGAAVSGATGWAGMAVAVRGNVRCAAAAVHGLNPALRVALDTGGSLALSTDHCELVTVELPISGLGFRVRKSKLAV